MASDPSTMSAKSAKKKTITHPPAWIRDIPRYLAALLILLFLFIRIGFREIPIERDEGSYAYMGQLVMKGEVPYRDFYEMKPPGLYYSYGLLSALSGGDVVVMHIWMALLISIGAMFLFYLVRRWLDAGAGVVATLAYLVLAMTSYASGFSIQAEHLVAFFAIVGLWALTRGLQTNSRRMFLLAGILLAYGLLVKQNGLFFALLAVTLVPAFHVSENRTQWLGNALRDGMWLAGGALIPVLVFGVLMAIQGTLADFWFWIIEYPRSYTSKIDWVMGRNLLENSLNNMYKGYAIYWILGLAGAAGIWLAPMAWYKKWAVTGFMLMAILSVMPGKRFYGHYFLHFFPALAVGVAAGVYTIGAWGSRLVPNLRLWLAPLFAVLLLMTTLAAQDGYYFRPNFNRILRQTYGSNPFPESRKLADYLSAQYQQGDGLLVLGSEPQLYAYTQAECPTRHHFMGFLLKNHPMEKEWQQEVIDAVESRPPKYVVWVQHPLSWLPAPEADQRIIDWGWSLIHSDYIPIAWYDQTDGQSFSSIEGDEAASYQARSKQYMVLLERRTRQ